MDPVKAVLERAHAEVLRARVKALTDADFAQFSAMLSLLADHPAVKADDTASAAALALGGMFVDLWERVEAAAGV